MLFKDLASYLEKLEKTSSRNEITVILAELFKKSDPSEIDKTVYLLSGRLAPNYKGINFAIAERMMFRVLARAYQKDQKEVEALFKKVGDIGEVAQELAEGRKGKGNLSVTEVYDEMMKAALAAGVASQDKKVEIMSQLLSRVDALSARFIARIPVGNLRLGFSDMTILDALSVMIKGDKSARKEIEAAFNVNVDIGMIAQKVKAKGLLALKNIDPVPGTPLRPSLCERLPSAEKILEKVGSPLAVEPKYDGFRSQVHIFKENGEKKIMIFSRNLESTTAMFPDIVEAVKKINIESAILDGEAIGFDPKTDKFLPFQETIQRKRKHGVEEAAKNLPLKLFVFDILSKNGKSLLALPFTERRKILVETIPAKLGKIEVTRQDVVSDPNIIRDLVKKYLSEGLEGAIVKKLDSEYKAGQRGYHWVKYKKTTEAGVADTIDLVVMGVNKGQGKRAGFGVGAFLVGVRDGNRFKTVSKIGTGLTDEQWRELESRSRKLESKEKPKEYEVDKNLEPDLWCKPSLVVEILADEITKSPIHTAGLALRFPRLIKFRDDKNPDQATTLGELRKLFEMQKA
jgi:DNA ligase-1